MWCAASEPILSTISILAQPQKEALVTACFLIPLDVVTSITGTLERRGHRVWFIRCDCIWNLHLQMKRIEKFQSLVGIPDIHCKFVVVIEPI